MDTSLPPTRAGAVEAVMKIAVARGVGFSEAAHSEAGRYILWLAEQLPPDESPVEKRYIGDPPAYLEAAAVEIAKSAGVSVEAAYGRIRRERPELAASYWAETT